jgi:hypothetical protein
MKMFLGCIASAVIWILVVALAFTIGRIIGKLFIWAWSPF